MDDLDLVPAAVAVAVGVVEVAVTAVVAVDGDEEGGDGVVAPAAVDGREEPDVPEVDVRGEEADEEPPEWWWVPVEAENGSTYCWSPAELPPEASAVASPVQTTATKLARQISNARREFTRRVLQASG